MHPLQYLTVQDILWINLQVTKRVHTFHFAKLEEATFYQYGYGESRNVPAQAGRFLSCFLQMKPFAAGNEETALIACATFLTINGYELRMSEADAKALITRDANSKTIAAEIERAAAPIENGGDHEVVKPEIRVAVLTAMEKLSA